MPCWLPELRQPEGARESRRSLLCPQAALGSTATHTGTPRFPTPLGLDGPGAHPLLLQPLSCPECSLVSGHETSGPIPMRAFRQDSRGRPDKQVRVLQGNTCRPRGTRFPLSQAERGGRFSPQADAHGPRWPCSGTGLPWGVPQPHPGATAKKEKVLGLRSRHRPRDSDHRTSLIAPGVTSAW